MTGLLHESTCTGAVLEHFGLPGPLEAPWHRTVRCVGCGAQSVLRVEPKTEIFGMPIAEPVVVGVPTVHSFP